MGWFDWRKVAGVTPDTSRGSTGLGPDFPTSAGDRERGKHRPSEYPRLTTVAVSNDDGTPVGTSAAILSRLDQVVLELQRLRIGLVAMDVAEDVKREDVREHVY